MTLQVRSVCHVVEGIGTWTRILAVQRFSALGSHERHAVSGDA